MSAPFLLWVVFAITLFWCVGFYNRVMRLRARGLDAFGSVEKHLRHFSEIVADRSLVGVGGDSSDVMLQINTTDGDWAQLIAQLQALDRSLKLARTAPLKGAELAEVSRCCANLTAVWMCLKTAPIDLAGPAIPEELERQWEENLQRVRSATAGFNQIIDRYHEAISQFPARLICSLFGFKPTSIL
jgi:LemA protein